MSFAASALATFVAPVAAISGPMSMTTRRLTRSGQAAANTKETIPPMDRPIRVTSRSSRASRKPVYQITPPRPEWQPHFQVRVLSEYQPRLRGMFTYPEPFDQT